MSQRIRYLRQELTRIDAELANQRDMESPYSLHLLRLRRETMFLIADAEEASRG